MNVGNLAVFGFRAINVLGLFSSLEMAVKAKLLPDLPSTNSRFQLRYTRSRRFTMLQMP